MIPDLHNGWFTVARLSKEFGELLFFRLCESGCNKVSLNKYHHFWVLRVEAEQTEIERLWLAVHSIWADKCLVSTTRAEKLRRREIEQLLGQLNDILRWLKMPLNLLAAQADG